MTRASFHSIIGRTIFGLGLFLGPSKMTGAPAGPPPAPASFVQDDGRLFDKASLERLSQPLIQLHDDCAVSVYVATSFYLDAGGNRNQAQQLVESWLKNQPGVILTCNRGDGQTGLVASPDLWRRHPADEIARLLSESGRILGQRGVSPELRIENAAARLAQRIRQLETDRHESRKPFATAERRLAITLAASLALTALLIGLVAIARRKNARACGGPFLFPEAAVHSRLGAQFGVTLGESSARDPG
jgi:hypothetical protein